MTRELTFAAGLIGKPWRAGAAGPDAFNCWGLVRHWFREVHGIDMADIAVAVDTVRTEAHASGRLLADADADQIRPILAAARAGGWRPVAAGSPLAGDIALMRNPQTGGRHVGVLLRANGALSLLHCEGGPERPLPGVQCPQLADAMRFYVDLELWRRVA